MKTDHERYRELQYKKDTGQAMSGHERMELYVLPEWFPRTGKTKKILFLDELDRLYIHELELEHDVVPTTKLFKELNE